MLLRHSGYEAAGLLGANAPSRYCGATRSGAPTTGTFLLGDFIVDQSATIWHCTTAGSPGTWTQIGASQHAGLITAVFFQAGTLTVGAGVGRWPCPVAGTILNARTAVGTAPTGATILVDINKGGTTVFTTQANRPSIAISGTSSSAAVPDVTSVAAGDLLSADIDQVGSTVAGADLTAIVTIHPT